jgi:hypothetical protein
MLQVWNIGTLKKKTKSNATTQPQQHASPSPLKPRSRGKRPGRALTIYHGEGHSIALSHGNNQFCSVTMCFIGNGITVNGW